MPLTGTLDAEMSLLEERCTAFDARLAAFSEVAAPASSYVFSSKSMVRLVKISSWQLGPQLLFSQSGAWRTAKSSNRAPSDFRSFVTYLDILSVSLHVEETCMKGFVRLQPRISRTIESPIFRDCTSERLAALARHASRQEPGLAANSSSSMRLGT